MKSLVRQATIGLLAPALFTTLSVAQSNVTGTPPPGAIGPRIVPPAPDVDGPGCAHGFAGTTTIAGGWTAFEAASGQTMTVLSCVCPGFSSVTAIATPRAGDLLLAPAHEKRDVGVS